eukprot:1337394-Amorphochlora_amoeboformis.AAC.1
MRIIPHKALRLHISLPCVIDRPPRSTEIVLRFTESILQLAHEYRDLFTKNPGKFDLGVKSREYLRVPNLNVTCPRWPPDPRTSWIPLGFRCVHSFTGDGGLILRAKVEVRDTCVCGIISEGIFEPWGMNTGCGHVPNSLHI